MRRLGYCKAPPIYPFKWQGIQLCAAALLAVAAAALLPAPVPIVRLDVTPYAVPDARVAVYNTTQGALVDMSLETYVADVVAGEMPALYEPEALKAQAVAARTRVLAGRCASHPEAQACTNHACCQAFLDEADQKARWGGHYEAYAQKIQSAVRATAGEIITYDGKPILVLYHAVSGGRTEDVELVFGDSLPYLRGVESEGEEDAARFRSEQRFPRADFAAQINKAFPSAKLTAKGLETQVEVLSRSASGRVQGLRLGGTHADGRDLRTALGLYSANFELIFSAAEVVVQETGYGHGVGMSQAGAEAMAKAGADYQEILLHYYTGVTIAHNAGPAEAY